MAAEEEVHDVNVTIEQAASCDEPIDEVAASKPGDKPVRMLLRVVLLIAFLAASVFILLFHGGIAADKETAHTATASLSKLTDSSSGTAGGTASTTSTSCGTNSDAKRNELERKCGPDAQPSESLERCCALMGELSEIGTCDVPSLLGGRAAADDLRAKCRPCQSTAQTTELVTMVESCSAAASTTEARCADGCEEMRDVLSVSMCGREVRALMQPAILAAVDAACHADGGGASEGPLAPPEGVEFPPTLGGGVLDGGGFSYSECGFTLLQLQGQIQSCTAALADLRASSGGAPSAECPAACRMDAADALACAPAIAAAMGGTTGTEWTLLCSLDEVGEFGACVGEAQSTALSLVRVAEPCLETLAEHADVCRPPCAAALDTMRDLAESHPDSACTSIVNGSSVVLHILDLAESACGSGSAVCAPLAGVSPAALAECASAITGGSTGVLPVDVCPAECSHLITVTGRTGTDDSCGLPSSLFPNIPPLFANLLDGLCGSADGSSEGSPIPCAEGASAAVSAVGACIAKLQALDFLLGGGLVDGCPAECIAAEAVTQAGTCLPSLASFMPDEALGAIFSLLCMLTDDDDDADSGGGLLPIPGIGGPGDDDGGEPWWPFAVSTAAAVGGLAEVHEDGANETVTCTESESIAIGALATACVAALGAVDGGMTAPVTVCPAACVQLTEAFVETACASSVRAAVPNVDSIVAVCTCSKAHFSALIAAASAECSEVGSILFSCPERCLAAMHTIETDVCYDKYVSGEGVHEGEELSELSQAFLAVVPAINALLGLRCGKGW